VTSAERRQRSAYPRSRIFERVPLLGVGPSRQAAPRGKLTILLLSALCPPYINRLVTTSRNMSSILMMEPSWTSNHRHYTSDHVPCSIAAKPLLMTRGVVTHAFNNT
jgi:hypothetical protein